jgi:hypothetical protein
MDESVVIGGSSGVRFWELLEHTIVGDEHNLPLGATAQEGRVISRCGFPKGNDEGEDVQAFPARLDCLPAVWFSQGIQGQAVHI